MKTSSIVSLFTTVIGFVVAQSTAPFYITNPIQGSVFQAGSSETITWINGIDETATVSLLTGTNSLTMKTTGVSFSINGEDGEYDWSIPTNLPQNATFSLQVEYNANGTVAYSYSSAFSITGTTGSVVTASFVTGASSIATAASSPILASSSASVSRSSAIVTTPIVQVTQASSPAASSPAASSPLPTTANSGAMTNKVPSFIVIVACIASSFII